LVLILFTQVPIYFSLLTWLIPNNSPKGKVLETWNTFPKEKPVKFPSPEMKSEIKMYPLNYTGGDYFL